MNLKNKPDFVIIPGVFQFHYVTNDDLGFSILSWINQYIGVPGKIEAKNFQKNILDKLDVNYYKEIMLSYYKIDDDGKYYLIRENIDKTDKTRIMELLSACGYRTGKWLLIVLLQSAASIFVIIMYFQFKHWRLMFPLVLFACGGLGNVIDRIIRGYVVDYAMLRVPIIPLRILNPWPIFNLADLYGVTGAIIIAVVIFFFTPREEKKEEKKEEKAPASM